MIAHTLIFPWNENFDTGMPIIDEQHRKLVDLLNDLARNLALGEDTLELNRVFDELADYAVYHFQTEEAIWKKYLPEDEMSGAHVKTHQSFVDEVLKLKNNLNGLSSELVVDEIVSFLTHWLAFHILETDKHMAKIVMGLQQGMDLAAAKDSANKDMSGAMRMLIDTLLKMYDNLTSRTLELLREIAERQRAEENLGLSKKIIESTLESIFITSPDCKIIDTNPSFCINVRREHDDLIGVSLGEIMPNLFTQNKKNEILTMASESGHWSGEVIGHNANNEMEAVWLTISAIKNKKGIITNFVGVLSSISQLLARHHGIVEAANHDALTGLPNRRLLQDRFELAITRSRRSGKELAVCFLDLDGFKQVNDTLGHEAGDEVLRIIAARLGHIVRAEDTVARLGGDEFVLLFGELENDKNLFSLLDRLMLDIEQPIYFQGKPSKLTASVGVTVYPRDLSAPDQLLLHADEAMYAAKHKGKSQYQFYC